MEDQWHTRQSDHYLSTNRLPIDTPSLSHQSHPLSLSFSFSFLSFLYFRIRTSLLTRATVLDRLLPFAQQTSSKDDSKLTNSRPQARNRACHPRAPDLTKERTLSRRRERRQSRDLSPVIRARSPMFARRRDIVRGGAKSVATAGGCAIWSVPRLRNAIVGSKVCRSQKRLL
jgi:hypothetical protein